MSLGLKVISDFHSYSVEESEVRAIVVQRLEMKASTFDFFTQIFI